VKRGTSGRGERVKGTEIAWPGELQARKGEKNEIKFKLRDCWEERKDSI